MSLYRIYRPKSFADVVGQDHIVTTLEQAAKQDKLAHAYLFAGQRGTGKTSVARLLAKVLLTRGIEDDAMAQRIIQAADDGSLVDFTEIDAASTRGIDDIRALLEKIQFTPVAAAAKVFIIDEVHMLTREAFNALLKTLEEPPPYAFFILATTELFKIPVTIQSRCQRFLFLQVREEEIIRRMQFVADQERITVERAALRAIAHGAQGSMRDALSLLDQLRSLERITLADVKTRIGETGHEYVEEVLAAVESRNGAAALELVRRMEESAVPMEGFLRLLLGEARARMHIDVDAGKDISTHVARLDALLRAVRDLRSAPVPGLAVETALLALCGLASGKVESQPAVSPAPRETPTARAQAVQAAAAVAKEENVRAVERKDAQPATPRSVEAPELTMEALRAAWSGIIDTVTPPSVRMSLKNGRIAGLQENVLTLHFGSAFHRDKVGAVEASRTVEHTLETVFKRPMRIHCLLESDAHTPVADGEIVNVADAAAEIF